MDKYTGKKISIKINGQERAFDENTTKKDEDLQKSGDSLPQREIAATKELHEEAEFHWVLPNDEIQSNKTQKKIIPIDDIRAIKTANPKKIKKNSTYSSSPVRKLLNKQLIFVIILAIVIGIAFGMFILKMVSNNKTQQVQTTGQVTTGQIEDNSGTKKPQAQAGEIPFQLKSLTVYVVQAGAFSGKDQASQFAESIKSATYPTAFFKKDKTFLFIGIGLTKEEGKALGSYYQNKGIEIYSKPYMVEGKTIKVKNKEWTENLAYVSGLFEQLVTATAVELNEKVISKDVWKGIDANYKKIDFAMLEKNSTLKKYISNVDQAYQTYASYQQNHSDEKLYQSQQALLDALQAYEAM